MALHNINFPKADEAMWDQVKQAAADESAAQGRTVSVSEWVRRAIRAALKA